MTDWVDFFVYALFIFSMFFVYPWTLGKLSVPMLVDRNAQWVKENRETLRRMERVGSGALWLQFAVGSVSLTMLSMVQLESITNFELPEKWILLWNLSSITGSDLPQKWALLWQLTVVSTLVSTLFFVALGILMFFVWMAKIPVSERRQADLLRRSIDDFIPLPVRLVTYLLVFIILTAWIVVAVLGWYEDPNFLKRLIRIFVISGFIWLTTSYSIGRRPNVMDRLFGLGYRRGEVLLTFSCLLLPVVIGSVRLYEEFAGVIAFNINRAIFLGSALYVTLWILWIGYLVASNLQAREGTDNTLINIK